MFPTISIYINYRLKLYVFTLEPNFKDLNNKFHFNINNEINEICKCSYNDISIIYIDENKLIKNYLFKSSFKYSRNIPNLNKIRYDNYTDYILKNDICLRFCNSDWLKIII